MTSRKRPRRPRGRKGGLFLSAALGGLLRAALLPAGGSGAFAGELQPASRVVADPERGEVRVPAVFVRAERPLEVFACHRKGPTHETVLVFDATGPELYRALTAIGCRPADDWNVTSAGDFLRTQGDRVLVSVRWTSGGGPIELPAEAFLLDQPISLPAFIRGFSFSARRPRPQPESGAGPGSASRAEARGEAPRRGGGTEADGSDTGGRDGSGSDNEKAGAPAGGATGAEASSVPDVVEITLGGAVRERAVYSLLTHPTTLRSFDDRSGGLPTREFLSWSFTPELDPKRLPELAELVEKETPVTLVLRRMPGEEWLVRRRRALASELGLGRRLPLYDRIEPLAREIDRLKARYLEIAREVHDLVARDPRTLADYEREDLAARGEELRRTGQWIASRIQELYFRMYYEEERHRLERFAAAEGVDPQLVAQVRTGIESGLRFEPVLAGLEVEIRAHALRDLVAHERARDLELERTAQFLAARLRAVEREISLLDPDAEFLRRMAEEDRMRIEFETLRVDARRRLIAARLERIRLLLEGRLDSEAEKRLESMERLAQAELQVARLREGLHAVLEQLRWEEQDAESGVPDREARARRKLVELRKKKGRIEEELRQAQQRLEALRASPPSRSEAR